VTARTIINLGIALTLPVLAAYLAGVVAVGLQLIGAI